ncbi:MAG: ScpA family protein [Legionellaceae bacterium]|nr:ScpA family protein [Legionellaceae bacterium]
MVRPDGHHWEAPKDLFIPPDALEVLLDSFSGPLDLLLYLIRRQHIDIMDIPIVRITQQYMQYIDRMEQDRMELAVDYLVMAAVLAEIKSRLLLPVITSDEGGVDIDPRMELVRRLQIYEQFKQAALILEQLPRRDRDVFSVRANTSHMTFNLALPDMSLNDLIKAQYRILERQSHGVNHTVKSELLSVRDRMNYVLQRLEDENCLEFTTLFQKNEGRMGLVVAFLAILELAKQSLLSVVQCDVFMPIYIKIKSNDE